LKTIGIDGHAWQKDNNGNIWMSQASGQLPGTNTSPRNNNTQISVQPIPVMRMAYNIPQARCYCDWLAQGIAHYNQLFDEIKEE
jgi:hypothetical protein